MKSIKITFLILAQILFLVGCTSSNDQTENTTSQHTEENKSEPAYDAITEGASSATEYRNFKTPIPISVLDTGIVYEDKRLNLIINQLPLKYHIKLKDTLAGVVYSQLYLTAKNFISKNSSEIQKDIFKSVALDTIIFSAYTNNKVKATFSLTSHTLKEKITGSFQINCTNYKSLKIENKTYDFTKDTLTNAITKKISVNAKEWNKDSVINFQDSTHYIFEAGTYYLKYDLPINNNHLLLEGKGDVNFICNTFYSNVVNVTGFNVTLKNLHFTHLKPHDISGDCSGNVLYFFNAHQIDIENCDINGCGVIGLYDAYDNSNIRVSNSHIHNNALCAFNGGISSNNEWAHQKEVSDHATFIFKDNLIENNGHKKVVSQDRTFMDDGVIFVYKDYKVQMINFIPNIDIQNIETDNPLNMESSENVSQAVESFFEDYDSPEGFSPRFDTIILSENYDEGFLYGTKFFVSPKEEDVDVRLFYSNHFEINEVIDERSTTIENDYVYSRLDYQSKFREIEDSAFLFKQPQDLYGDSTCYNEMRDKFNFRDTSFVIPGEYSTNVDFTKDNKLFSAPSDYIIFRLDTYENDQFVKSNFILVYFILGC